MLCCRWRLWLTSDRRLHRVLGAERHITLSRSVDIEVHSKPIPVDPESTPCRFTTIVVGLLHPKPNSFISEVIPARSRYGSHTAPNDKEGRKLDVIGLRVYSSGAMGLRVVNFAAVMGLYNHLL
ncbi:UNVERIFIED_CONTAM: hypothetical protein K2H54_074440 [Gekko kuhli]